MRRKTSRKIASSRKTATKRPTTRTTNHLATALERNFKEIPAKLVSQLNKEANTLTQKEKKLRIELKKADAQMTNLKKKRTSLTMQARKTPSARNKKQLKLLNATHDKANKTSQVLSKQLGQIKTEIHTIVTKKAKYAAIPTLLNKFTKQWELKAKKASKAVSTKNSRKTLKKQKLSIDAATPVLENASFQISATSTRSN